MVYSFYFLLGFRNFTMYTKSAVISEYEKKSFFKGYKNLFMERCFGKHMRNLSEYNFLYFLLGFEN